MQKRPHQQFIGELLTAIVLVAMMLFLFASTGCTTHKKATRYFDRHPAAAADYFAAKYPTDTTTTTQDSTSSDTLEMEPVIIIDTQYVEGEPQLRYRACPPHKVITQTKTRTIERTVENTAKTRSLQLKIEEGATLLNKAKDQLIKTQQQLGEAKAAKQKWFWLFIALAALTGGAIALKLKKAFTF